MAISVSASTIPSLNTQISANHSSKLSTLSSLQFPVHFPRIRISTNKALSFPSRPRFLPRVLLTCFLFVFVFVFFCFSRLVMFLVESISHGHVKHNLVRILRPRLEILNLGNKTKTNSRVLRKYIYIGNECWC